MKGSVVELRFSFTVAIQARNRSREGSGVRGGAPYATKCFLGKILNLLALVATRLHLASDTLVQSAIKLATSQWYYMPLFCRRTLFALVLAVTALAIPTAAAADLMVEADSARIHSYPDSP